LIKSTAAVTTVKNQIYCICGTSAYYSRQYFIQYYVVLLIDTFGATHCMPWCRKWVKEWHHGRRETY